MKRNDVHTRHCCKTHGCKYGEDSICSVVALGRKQEYPCELCGLEEQMESDGTEDASEREEVLMDLVKKLIKKNLSVRLSSYGDYYSSGFRVTLYYDGEEISEDTFSLPSDHYN